MLQTKIKNHETHIVHCAIFSRDVGLAKGPSKILMNILFITKTFDDLCHVIVMLPFNL